MLSADMASRTVSQNKIIFFIRYQSCVFRYSVRKQTKMSIQASPILTSSVAQTLTRSLCYYVKPHG